VTISPEVVVTWNDKEYIPAEFNVEVKELMDKTLSSALMADLNIVSATVLDPR